MIVDEQTYLEHYGVKGMKWGIRKDRAGSGSGTKTKKQSFAQKNVKRYHAKQRKREADDKRRIEQGRRTKTQNGEAAVKALRVSGKLVALVSAIMVVKMT